MFCLLHTTEVVPKIFPNLSVVAHSVVPVGWGSCLGYFYYGSGDEFMFLVFCSDLQQWKTCPSVNVDQDLYCTCYFDTADFYPLSIYKMQVSTGSQRDRVPLEIFSVETNIEIG